MFESVNEKYRSETRGRPPVENPKDSQYRLRMDDKELKMLEYSSKMLDLTKAEVFRLGLWRAYQDALENEGRSKEAREERNILIKQAANYIE